MVHKQRSRLDTLSNSSQKADNILATVLAEPLRQQVPGPSKQPAWFVVGSRERRLMFAIHSGVLMLHKISNRTSPTKQQVAFSFVCSGSIPSPDMHCRHVQVYV